jgi:hypothetical protein
MNESRNVSRSELRFDKISTETDLNRVGAYRFLTSIISATVVGIGTRGRRS